MDPINTADPTNLVRNPITIKGTNKLDAPKNIVSTVYGAKAIYFNYRTDHLKRIDLYAQIMGLIAGNPPYDPVELDQAKLSHIANFNTLDGRSLWERACLAYWNLLNESATIATFTVKIPGLPEAADYGRKISRHFNDVIRLWPNFNVVFNTLSAQLVMLGISPIIWPDERDWRFRVVQLSRFYVEDQAQADTDFLTCVCVETVFTLQYLWQVYHTFSEDSNQTDDSIIGDNQKDGWNIAEVRFLLLYYANTYVQNQQGKPVIDMVDLQTRLQNNDLNFTQVFSDSVRIVSLLYKEYNGKISHYMFHPWVDNGHFLFKETDQYNNFEEAIIIFTASPGEYTIHSNKGLGHKIFSGIQAKMQTDCAVVDSVKMASTPLVKTLPGNKDFEKIRFYPGVATDIGTAEFVENTLGTQVDKFIGVSQYIMQMMEFNTSNSGDNPAFPDKNVGSVAPSEGMRRDFKEFGVLKNNIAHFYETFDRVLKNIVIKMLNSKEGYPGYEFVEEWKERCLADNVPKEIFSMAKKDFQGMPRTLGVKATRVAGSGSNLARISGIQAVMPIAAGWGPKGQRFLQEEAINAFFGPDYVDAFLQDAGDPDESAGGASLAAVENAVMRLGESPVFSPDNEQQSHFVTHLALGNDTIRRIQQQQMSPVDADKIFTVLIPHMAEHWQAIQINPFHKPFFEQHKKVWDQLADYARLNHKNAAEMLQKQIREKQEQAQKTQEVLSDEQLKNLQAKGAEERANFKTQAQVERAKEASDTRAEIMREGVVKKADNERLDIQLKNRNKTLENANKEIAEKPLDELRTDLSHINGVTPAPYDIEGA